MTNPAMPQFFASPMSAWVTCESAESLGSSEVVCSVLRIFGGESVIIASTKFVDLGMRKIQGIVIGAVGENGRLVDFPSGDRVAVPENKIQIVNGSSV